MNAYQPIELAGATLWLLAEKAIYWPAQQALLVADIHFGKAAAYRRLGQPVPHGTTDANLRQLDGLLARYCCRQLIFLGDFLHAPNPMRRPRLRAWPNGARAIPSWPSHWCAATTTAVQETRRPSSAST